MPPWFPGPWVCLTAAEYSDGCAAAIITTPEIAKARKKDPVFVKALQIAMAPRDGNFTQNFDFLHVEATVRAAERAYEEAGIKNPREEISDAREFRILAHQKVIDLFLDEESQSLAMLGDFIGKPISLQVESLYTQEQYDIVLM